MITLKEQVDIPAPYERLETWIDNFEEEFVRWSPYHIECELYDGGYQVGNRIRFREIVMNLDYNVTGMITEYERDQHHFRVVFRSGKKTAFIIFEGGKDRNRLSFFSYGGVWNDDTDGRSDLKFSDFQGFLQEKSELAADQR